jgi:hypothetical protein
MQQTHALDGRTWHWCPKCGTNGKWVCTHHPSQHGDTFVKKRPSEGATHNRDKRPTPSPPPSAHVASTVTPEALAQLVAAQVSNQLQARSPPPPAPLVNTAQTPPTFEINRLVAEQVQQQLKVHYAATPPTFGAPHYPTPPNFGPPTDVLDW